MAWQDDPVIQSPDEAWRNDPIIESSPTPATPDTGDDEHDLLYYKTGKTKSEREALNKPLREAMQVPAVSPETIAKGLQAVSEIGATSPEDLSQGPVQKSINDEIAKAISGLTTGEGVSSLPLYAFPPTAVGLTAENAQELPGQIGETAAKIKEGDYPGAASAGTRAALNALMIGGVLHGGAELTKGKGAGIEIPSRAGLGPEPIAPPEVPPPTDVALPSETARFTPEPPPIGTPLKPVPLHGEPGTTAADVAAAQQAAPPAPEGAAAEPAPAGASSASVPVMITRQMEADLRALGHTQAEINAMTPQQANDILRQQPQVAPPAPEAPVIPPEDVRYAGGEPPALTSTKNVVTAAEREARGFAPAEQAAVRDFGTVWDEAAKDTGAPERLVASLKLKPRALNDIENAHLLRRQIELQNEHDVMTRLVNEETDPAKQAAAKERLDFVRNDLQDVYDVGKSVGTETGRGLNARKMLADQNYALANMEATTRAIVNDGKPLSEVQTKEVAKLHERIRAAEDRISAYEAMDAFNKTLKEEPRRPVLSFLDEQAVKARERISARRTRLYADPLGITNVAHLADEAIIGASHIARGLTKFADWSAQMISEFGERIKPFLAGLFERSRKIHNESNRRLATAISPAEREVRALAGEKKRIITRTEQLKAKTAAGEFERATKKPPRMDTEKARLLFEYQKAKEAFDRGLFESELKKRSRPQRIFATGREALSLPRALLASTDFSAVRRQGGIYTMIHPLVARHAFADMLRATKSELGYFKVMQEIKDRGNAQEYKRFGLELTDIGPVSRSRMEEQFQSRWAEKIPLVSHSQRAYTAFLNRARADWYDLLKNSLTDGDKALTEKQGKAIANAVNVFTGRGAVSGKWLHAMTALNDVFFAPRWRMSRFQTLLGQPLWKNSGARGVIAKEYAKALIGYGSIMSLLGWAMRNTSTPMEKNPVSTEFGKVRIGNTRIDLMQGLQQPTVFMSRLLSGRTKTAKGEIQKIYGDVGYGKTTASDVITHFLRSSLAPVPGGIWNLVEQKNVVGEPVTLPSSVRDLTVPLLGQDVYDAMKEQGVPTGAALGLIALFGDSIQTYSPRVAHPKGHKYERKLY